MPFLPFFADVTDARRIIDWLNNRNDIAFLLPDDPDRWKAVRRLDRLSSKDSRNDLGDYYKYLLWLACEPIGFIDAYHRPVIIRDPWKGWTGREADNQTFQTGSEFSTPDVDSPGIFSLDLCTRYRPYTKQEKERLKVLQAALDGTDDFMRISSFHWDRTNSDIALGFWRLLEEWVSKRSTPLGGGDEDEDGKWQFWAFPSALKKLKGGIKYDANGFPLDDAIKNAPLSRR